MSELEGALIDEPGGEESEGEPGEPSRGENSRHRRHEDNLPPIENDDSKRPRHLRDRLDIVVQKLRGLHRRAKVEFAFVAYDPVKRTTWEHTSPGLQQIWAGIGATTWAPTLHTYNRYRNAMQQAATPGGEPNGPVLRFKDLPGGLEVQMRVTEHALALAIPGKGRDTSKFYEDTTPEQLREMSCRASAMSYETWPEGLPFTEVKNMTVDHMEKAFSWAVRFVTSYDPHAMVGRLSLGDAIVHEDNEHLTSEGRYNIAMRLVRGVIAHVERGS